jgi:lipopolysaccharide/colanic/teichoic acid biosynthesis glycosyltransferase
LNESPRGRYHQLELSVRVSRPQIERAIRRSRLHVESSTGRKLNRMEGVCWTMGSSAIDRYAPALEGQPSQSSRSALSQRLVDASCRALDILVSAITLIVLAPMLAVIAIAIKLDSAGPVLFRQQRFGRNARPFTVNKFRTMHDGAAHDRHREFVLGLINGEHTDNGASAPTFKMTSDLRVTRFGRVLRRSSLDELPQLWNVLRGEMSLVGPRPPVAYEIEHYPPHWFARFAVKPGITGMWQVNGRSEVPLEQMVSLDIEYAQRRSLWLNLWLLARTVPAVLNRRGAW